MAAFTAFEAHLIYALAWVGFGLGHSWLAGPAAKAMLKSVFGPYYRLCYNLFAGLHIALVFVAGRILLPGGDTFASASWVPNVLLAVHILGWLMLLRALKDYDLGLFSGTRQIRNHKHGIEGEEDESLLTGGLHAYVRHPLYSGALMILWGGAVGEYGLATALWGSLYLFIGTCFEERKLIRLYGAAYADYRRRVPAIIPWKGKAI